MILESKTIQNHARNSLASLLRLRVRSLALCELIVLHCFVLSMSQVFGVERELAVDGLAVVIKNSVYADVLQKGTPVYVFELDGPLAFSGFVEDDGVIKCPVIIDHPYTMVVDTLGSLNNETSPNDILIPPVVNVRVTQQDDNLYGARISVIARSLLDFRSSAQAIDELILATNAVGWSTIQEGVNSEKLKDFHIRLATLWKRLGDDAQPGLINKIEITDQDESKWVQVEGVAAKYDEASGKWNPNDRRQVWAFTRNKVDLISQSTLDDSFTNQHGRFIRKIPRDTAVTILVNGKVEGSVVKSYPVMVDVCPTAGSQADVSPNHDLLITAASERNHSWTQADRDKYLQQCVNILKQIANNERDQQRKALALAAGNDLEQQIGKPIEPQEQPNISLNSLSVTSGKTPTDDWEKVHAAAKKHPNTIFWIVVNPGGAATFGWERPFSRFLSLQDLGDAAAGSAMPSKAIGKPVGASQKKPQAQKTKRSAPANPDAGPRGLKNFRILGYLSLYNNKADVVIDKELDSWAPGGERLVYGLFLDNFETFPIARRQPLFEKLKNRGFAVFGTFGYPPKPGLLGNKPIADWLCVQKASSIALAPIKACRRQMAIETGLGVIKVNVDRAEVRKSLSECFVSGIRFVCLSEFKPETPQGMYYDKPIPLPSYWEDLFKELEAHNSVAHNTEKFREDLRKSGQAAD